MRIILHACLLVTYKAVPNSNSNPHQQQQQLCMCRKEQLKRTGCIT